MSTFRKSGFPRTFLPVGNPPHVCQAHLFDPALLHYSRAFRLGDPEFNDPETTARWYSARSRVMFRILHAAVSSPLGNHLVLRGSLALRAWLGQEAREPGDIDWVVRPQQLGLSDPDAGHLVVGIVEQVARNADIGDGIIVTDRISVDDIWTYERAPGRRIAFRWEAPGVPWGSLQMDLVFGEELWMEPISTCFAGIDGETTLVPVVTPELSLAWKILWLLTDIHPQGKDLYDAVLLAERTFLPYELLDRVLKSAEYAPLLEKLEADFPLEWEVDWKNFRLEYPWIPGEALEWQTRLASALAHMFEGRE